MNNLVQIAQLNKTFHNGQEEVFALKNISLRIDTKDYLAIVGPSGAGKSTLLHIIGGLDEPSGGCVTYKGRDVYAMGEKERALWRNQSVGFVFQFYHLIEELNVLENVAIGSFVRLRKSAFKTAQTLLEYLNIEERKNFFPSQLSGGERQKVALARALINDPEIVLCDEPTGNLDKDSQDKVVELLERLNTEKQKTVILVTHNLELAKRAKRMITLKSGEMVIS
ncbi:MAG: ABC transporter ATP-binding protein [Candidatus Omnitrophica bacterium]|jgi:ABC-type lipoprotein export system ATPase subunit|nr:ABC transporter ATP-binding protein [Candidatus Omnitrophota bacterium]